MSCSRLADSGKVDADFSVEKGERGPVVKGGLELADGVLTAMPLLDSLSAYADTTRFRRLALEDGRVDAVISNCVTISSTTSASHHFTLAN